MRGGWIGLLVWLVAGGAAAESELVCLVEPRQTVTLSFAIEGVVQEVLVDRGDRVEKGQVLARLLADVERASLAVARARADSKAAERGSRAQLEYADLILERQNRLQKEEIVSEGLMDQARREKRIAEAGLLDAEETRRVAALEAERAAAVLAMRSVESPIDGVVVRRILSPGEWADPPQVLELAQIDPLRVEVFLPLNLLGRVEVGQQARVRIEEPVGGLYDAKVTVVDSVVDAASGTFGARLELPNPDYKLPAGVRCQVEFDGVAELPRGPDRPLARSGADGPRRAPTDPN